MTDIDERLREYALRWQAIQPPPPAPLFDASRPSRLGWVHTPSHIRIMVAVAAAVVAVGVLTGVLIDRHGTNPAQVSTANPTANPPVAKPPLLRHRPHTTAQIDLTSGRSGGTAWTFFALYTSKETPAGVGPGLCLGIAAGQSSGTECDDPTTMSALTVGVTHLAGNANTLLVSGVTSAPATSFLIYLAKGTVTVPALASPDLLGLRFYAAQISASQYPGDFAVRVEALTGGTPLLRNDPRQTAPLVPANPPSEPSGLGTLWPLPGTAGAGLNNPIAVAADFATKALGLAHPTVTVRPGGPSDGITTVIIALPPPGKNLQAVAQPLANGTWALIQVGNQDNLRGITLLPNGHPGAVMSLIPPSGATQAEVTEVAADTTHYIHLNAAQLATDTVHLIGSSIQSTFIVYKNNAGAVLDAIGGTFG
jgi:hypothetical protein